MWGNAPKPTCYGAFGGVQPCSTKRYLGLGSTHGITALFDDSLISLALIMIAINAINNDVHVRDHDSGHSVFKYGSSGRRFNFK